MTDISKQEMGLIIGLVIGTLFLALLAVLIYILYDKQKDKMYGIFRITAPVEQPRPGGPPGGGQNWTTINNSMVGLEIDDTNLSHGGHEGDQGSPSRMSEDGGLHHGNRKSCLTVLFDWDAKTPLPKPFKQFTNVMWQHETGMRNHHHQREQQKQQQQQEYVAAAATAAATTTASAAGIAPQAAAADPAIAHCGSMAGEGDISGANMGPPGVSAAEAISPAAAATSVEASATASGLTSALADPVGRGSSDASPPCVIATPLLSTASAAAASGSQSKRSLLQLSGSKGMNAGPTDKTSGGSVSRFDMRCFVCLNPAVHEPKLPQPMVATSPAAVPREGIVA